MSSQKIYTLIFITRNTDVLLGLKTRGLGVGLWNGFGGKVEANETILDGAVRELNEESNLQANLKQIGIVTYKTVDSLHEEVVHIFSADKYTGTIMESEEMAPIKWFPFNQLPFNNMWPDAKSWVPMIFENNFFLVNVMYADGVISNIQKQKLTDKIIIN